ncbi:hypothetical protein G7Y79_00061g093110 [Physcia stellaris]|nr:hypothetical protein G7Y79_00061g093110 [Physcia stellaris]
MGPVTLGSKTNCRGFSTNLPPDPYFYHPPSGGETDIVIKFYHFGLRRPHPIDVFVVLRKALEEVSKHYDEKYEALGTKKLHFENRETFLLLQPGNFMDWEDLGIMIRGLLHFANSYESVEYYYEVIAEGDGVLGTGALSSW